MSYDLDLVRNILRAFRARGDSADYIDTDGVTLSPPFVAGADPDSMSSHLDRLTEIGFIRHTHEIRSRHRPDPVTLRPTEAGREWIRRAWTDRDWLDASPELQRLLEADPAP